MVDATGDFSQPKVDMLQLFFYGGITMIFGLCFWCIWGLALGGSRIPQERNVTMEIYTAKCQGTHVYPSLCNTYPLENLTIAIAAMKKRSYCNFIGKSANHQMSHGFHSLC